MMFTKSTSLVSLVASISFLTLASPAPTKLEVRQDSEDHSWAKGSYIAIVGARNECLSPATSGSDTNANATEGTKVEAVQCHMAATWSVPLVESGGAIVHEDSGLVIDLGQNVNNGNLTLQTFSGDDQTQIFNYGADNRLSNNATGKCIDRGDDGLQIYDCRPNNVNQVWLIRTTPEAKALDDDAPTRSDASSSNSDLKYIQPKERKDLCISTISDGSSIQSNAGVALTYCAGSESSDSGNSTSADLMQWSLSGKEPGQVKLGSSGLCLETGGNVINSYGYEELTVVNAMGVRMATCDDQAPGQKWSSDQFMLKSAIEKTGVSMDPPRSVEADHD
ncbi:uncharacterized protein I303_103860 [Kwoniella dejecticola CBS 10117]|uniref:Ricin B lectin domain-containing protein n=1 Tax=Kwoniella dejecticola CBS 10117 TaxID=1296121 RepID=A0A1A6A7X4_9TREE|nr:uncharacterized protein I303_03879 [Kwoniella dejecticola CBS 10117]OBR86159.1 hypothetical protein I303_03879 [Kwoniella dejecticola CBS 10117]